MSSTSSLGWLSAFEEDKGFEQGAKALQTVPSGDLGQDWTEEKSQILWEYCRLEAPVDLQPQCLCREWRRKRRVHRGGQRGVDENAGRLVHGEFAILVRQGVDSGSHDGCRSRQERRHVGWQREDAAVADDRVGPQEFPCLFACRRCSIKADMATPYRRYAAFLFYPGTRSERLRVMYD